MPQTGFTLTTRGPGLVELTGKVGRWLATTGVAPVQKRPLPDPGPLR